MASMLRPLLGAGAGRRATWIAALLALVLSFASPALAAPDVQPSTRVQHWVNVRQAPDTNSPATGRLEPGQSAEILDVVPGWYHVRLGDGQTGYVSRGWVVIVGQAAAAGAPVYRVHLIDVGTGLSVFSEGPGFAILYDAGSNDDDALGSRNRVLAYIRHVRPDLTTFDHVILSHPHQDHVALLPDVLMTYQVRNVWDSGRDYKNCQYHAFLRAIRDRNIPYHDADSLTGPHVVQVPQATCRGHSEPAQTIVIPHSDHIQIGVPIALGTGARMTFLHAEATPFASPNDNSLVMALDLGNSRVLFIGDAQAGGRADPSAPVAPNSTEAKLLACCRALLRSDVLIAGHHGSKTSSRTETLQAIGAYLFLVSSGPHKYSGTGLPDHEVIEEFQKRGTVYRTDLDDAACERSPAKVGPDNDGQPGGCDNVVLSIDAAGHISAAYDRSPDDG